VRRIRGLRYIERFNFHHVNRRQTVAEHSYFVAYYAMIIAKLLGEDEGLACKLAMLHDVHEVVTGDMPHLYEKTIDIKLLEHSYAGCVTEGYFKEGTQPQYSNIIEDIVEFADLFEVKIYLEEERKSGNMHLFNIEREVYMELIKFDLDRNAKDEMICCIEPVKPKDETNAMTHEGEQWEKLRSI